MKLLLNLKRYLFLPKIIKENKKKMLHLIENAVNCLKNKSNEIDEQIWLELNPTIEKIEICLQYIRAKKESIHSLAELNMLIQSVSLILAPSPEKVCVDLSEMFKDISAFMANNTYLLEDASSKDQQPTKVDQFTKSINDRINQILGLHKE